jgi:hypothetical protein
MWTVEYRPHRRRGEGGTAGLARRRRLFTPDGQLDQRPRARGAYLRTVQTGSFGRSSKACPGWRAWMRSADTSSNTGAARPIEADCPWASFGDIALAIEANNLSRGATTIEQNGEGYGSANRPRRDGRRDRDIAVSPRKHPCSNQGYRRGQNRRSGAPAARANRATKSS